MDIGIAECVYFNNCTEYINNLKYYIKHNKINKLLIHDGYYKEMYSYMEKIYKINIATTSNKSLLYLNKDIFKYIYKYGYKYKSIFETCQIINQIIMIKHFFIDRKLNLILHNFENILNLGYYIDFIKYLKRKKSKSYIIVMCFMATYLKHIHVKLINDLKDIKLKYLSPANNIYKYKYKYEILYYLNKYNIVSDKFSSLKMLCLLKMNCLIQNKAIKHNYHEIIETDYSGNIQFIFEELIIYGIIYDNFNELSIFINFICTNKDSFSGHLWFDLISNIFNFINIYAYKNTKQKYTSNKILHIDYNLCICKNKNKSYQTVNLFNNISLYNALYPLITDNYFYYYNKDLCKNIIKYLNIHEKNYRYLFNETLILKTIKNYIIQSNIINTFEFEQILYEKKTKMQIFSSTYKFDLY